MSDRGEIGNDELLYRKVPVKPGWYDPERNELKPDALTPRKDDTAGISFDRAASESHPEFRSAEQAGHGRSPAGYYVAVFKAGDLRSHGFSIIADPQPGNPGHALLEDLTYSNRKDPSSQEKRVELAHDLVIAVEGPFHSDLSG